MMTTVSYTEEAIQASPLLDKAQWQSLLQELTVELLQQCAKELLHEMHEEWVHGVEFALKLEHAAFCRVAHKAAGAAGTMGFARLRHVFLCLEQGGPTVQTLDHLNCIATLLKDTELELEKELQK